MSVPFSKVLTGLSLPHVGEETAILLAQNFKTIDTLCAASADGLESIDGIGPIVAQALVEWFAEKENKELIKRLKKVLHIANPDFSTRSNLVELPFFGKTFVLTGTMKSLSRD